MRLKLLGITVAFILSTGQLSAQMFLSEVAFAPGGSDDSNEFIEVRGNPGATIPANTYVVFIEGDSDDPGDVNIAFDLSGEQFGSNGYLVYTLSGNSYNIATGANEITSTTVNWQGHPNTIGTSNNIEDLSETILLVTTTNPITGTSDDIDDDNDGEIDITGWTILDGISLLDNDDVNEYGYADLIYTNNLAGTIHPSSATLIEVDFNGGYVSRIGESTGSTNNDWFYASTSNAPADINNSSSDQAFSDETVTEVGGPSYVFAPFTFTGTENLTTVQQTQDLIITSSVSTSDDIECHNLIINSGQTLTLENSGSVRAFGSITINGNLVVESGGTLLAHSGKDVDAATFRRNTTFSDGRYSFVGTPVQSDPSITGSDLGGAVFRYDESVNFGADGLARWISAGSTQLEVGVGYTQAFQEEIEFIGIANAGTINVDVTHTTGAANNLADRGFNLVSNPYPAAIEADELLQLPGAGSNSNTNNNLVDGAIYLWDDGGSDVQRGDNGDYLTWNGVGEVLGPNSSRGFQGQIRSMQGFFVRVTSPGSGSLEFNEDMRATGDNSDGRFFREGEDEIPEGVNIRMTIESTDGNLFNQLLIGLRSDATFGKDRAYDAMKLSGNNLLQFYSIIEGDKYAIQGLPFQEGVSTELGFDLSRSQTLKLTVNEITNLEKGRTFYLFDKITGSTYNLKETATINFNGILGTDQNRFVLRYDLQDEISADIAASTPTYRFANNELQVNFAISQNVQGYTVHDLSGKVISEELMSGEATDQMVIPITDLGINIVRITTDEGVITRKFLFSR